MIKIFKLFILTLRTRKWLLVRRTVQLLILSAFLIELPGYDQIAVGNLSSSIWFGTVPLTDPFILMQSLLAGAVLATPVLLGAALVAAFYALFGGRIYCSWVCPINMLTDAAHWLRQRLNLKGNLALSRDHRTVILITALMLCLVCGTLAWEIVNPITMFQRELMWTSLAGVAALVTLFLFDLLVSRRGWCGHLCPVGAFYSWLGRYGRLRITAREPGACATGCKDCLRACPEPHVLGPLITQNAAAVTSGDCTRCGACLDACSTGRLEMQLHMHLKGGKAPHSIPIVNRQ